MYVSVSVSVSVCATLQDLLQNNLHTVFSNQPSFYKLLMDIFTTGHMALLSNV